MWILLTEVAQIKFQTTKQKFLSFFQRLPYNTCGVFSCFLVSFHIFHRCIGVVVIQAKQLI